MNPKDLGTTIAQLSARPGGDSEDMTVKAARPADASPTSAKPNAAGAGAIGEAE